jgi:4-amino-4-deoxy-L-arabinose transferase-like glycosyltransferase
MSHRDRLLGLLHFVLLGCGIAAVVYGFASSAPLSQELWTELGRRHFLSFLRWAVPIAFLVPWILRKRWPIGCVLAAGVFFVVAFGVVPVLGVLTMLASCVCLGRLTFGRFFHYDDGLTSFVIDALLGFALLSLFLNIAVHFPCNTQSLYIAVLAIPIILGRQHIVTLWQRTRMCLLSAHEFRPQVAVMGALLGMVLATHVIVAAMPERYHDALALHLRMCTTIAHDRCWSFDCANFAPAVMPMNGDLYYMVGYLLGGEPGARLVNLLFFLMIVVLLHGEVQRRCGSNCALLAAALFASIPVAFLETASLFVENVLTAFLLGSFVVLVRSDKEWRGRIPALALLLGAAASTKLHGIIAAGLILGTAMLMLSRQQGMKAALRLLLPAAIVFTIFGAPPYVAAYCASGNPVFPFYNAVFKSPYFPSATNFTDAKWGRICWGVLYDMTFQTHRYLEALDGAAGFQFLCLGLAGAVMCCVRRDRVAVSALLIGLAYVFVIGSFTMYLRYLYPVFPLLTIACIGPGLTQLGARWPRWITYGMGVALIGVNVLFMPSAAWVLRTFDCQAVWSERQRVQVVDAFVPQRRLVEAVNGIAGADARVMFIGASYATGLWGKAYYLNWYDMLFLQQILDAKEPEDAVRVLSNVGITHAMVSPGSELPNSTVLGPVFATHMKLVAKLNGACLYSFQRTGSDGSQP